MKILKDKKGVNDVSIMGIILAIFLLSALIIPFINSAYDTGHTEYNVDKLTNDAREDTETVNSFNAFTVVINVFKLAFWDIGDTLNLPFWLDGFYTLLTIIAIFILARNIWIGGGG